MSDLLQDLRQTWRSAVRAPATTAVLLCSLALGTGANAAVYGVMRSLLLSAPAGVDDSSDLVSVFTSEFSGATFGPSSYADFDSARSATGVFQSTAAINDHAIENVQSGPFVASARIAAVTAEFFGALRMTPLEGRLLTPADVAANATVAVLSASLSSQLGGAQALVGKVVAIGGRPYSVVGVAPPRFRGLRIGRECDVWIPLPPPASPRGDRRLAVIARLSSGV